MIMSCEQCLRTLPVIMDIFHDGTRDGHTVISGCSTSDFIEKHQRTLRKIMQNHGCLQHLHHKRRLAARNIVRSTDTSEQFVEISEFRRFRRNERTDLRHKHYKRGLPEQCRLSGHVRTRQNDNLLILVIQMYVVRHIFFPGFHQCLYDRVTSGLYIQSQALPYFRTTVMTFHSELGKPCQHIQLRDRRRIHLDSSDTSLHLSNQRIIDR